MAVIRVHKTKDYTVMSNVHFREKEMTLKAKGLLSLMLSLPDDWNYSIAGLVAICVEKESAIVSTLKELKKFGYLRVDKLMPNQTESGRIEYIYNVFEKPQEYEEQGEEKQGVENQGLEFQGVENQVQLSTNKSITKISSINKLNTDKKKKESKSDSFDQLIQNYCDTLPFEQSEKVKGLLQEWLKVRKAKRAAMTDKSIELNLNKLTSLANKSGLDVADYLEEVICRGWQAFYEIKDYNTPQQGLQQKSNGNVFLDIAKEEHIF